MRKKVKITKESLIRDIAKASDKNIYDVREMYDAFESVIFKKLATVNEDEDVCIKLFEGINLDGEFIPEHTKKNNLTGKLIHVDSKIKPKFNITRYYCEKLNGQN